MYEIKEYEAEYESEGELFEDFPFAFDINYLGYNEKTGLFTFIFHLRQSVDKLTIQGKCK